MPNEGSSTPLDFHPPLCFEDDDRQNRRDGIAEFVGARLFKTAIREITGVSLYGYLTSETVLAMAELLEKFAAKPWPLPACERGVRGWASFSAEEYRDIARMFRAYGGAGYCLSGN
jgi:hypothetical protein